VSAAAPTELELHIDGASRGNPGEAGFGVHASAGGATVAELFGYLGRASNNVAEYQALIGALEYAASTGTRRVAVFSDSELVVKQVNGVYRVKHPDMIPLHRKARTLLGRFDEARVSHVRREQNREADALANRAVDERRSNWPPERA
jgi:ribonuclease HI